MRVLIAGLGEHKEFGLRSLRDAGHVVGVLEEPHRVPIDSCDWWAPADYLDVDSLVAAARGSDEPWDAVLCWEEVAVDVAHEAARRLGLPHPRMPAGTLRDKGMMHERVRAAGLPTPQLGVVTSLAQARDAAGGRYPVVVKPADFGGSCGVRLATDAEDLATAYQAAAALSENVVIDQYVVGPEYSVEAVTWAPGETTVICVVEKRLTPPPYCVELGHRAPARLGEADAALLAEHACRVLDAVGMASGVSHGEYKLTPAGPVLMEVAGRPAGGQIPRLVRLVTGWNLYLAELAAVLGDRAAGRGGAAGRGRAAGGGGAAGGAHAGRSANQFADLAADPAANPAADPEARCGAIHFFTGDGRVPSYRPITAAMAASAPLRGVLREVRYWVPPQIALPPPRDTDDRAGFALVAGTPDEVTRALSALSALP